MTSQPRLLASRRPIEIAPGSIAYAHSSTRTQSYCRAARRVSHTSRSLSPQMSAYDRTKNLGFFRDATVTWLSGRFDSTPQSLMLAISLLDRFLGIVSVRIARSRAFSQRFLFLSGQSEIPQVSRCHVLLHRGENDARKQGRRVFFVESRGRSRFSHARRKRYRRKKSRAYATTSSRRPISSEWSASC